MAAWAGVGLVSKGPVAPVVVSIAGTRAEANPTAPRRLKVPQEAAARLVLGCDGCEGGGGDDDGGAAALILLSKGDEEEDEEEEGSGS